MIVKRKPIKTSIIQQDRIKITLLQPCNKTTFLVFPQGRTEKMSETILRVVEKPQNKNCKKQYS